MIEPKRRFVRIVASIRRIRDAMTRRGFLVPALGALAAACSPLAALNAFDLAFDSRLTAANR